jgi:hypothetical protein
MRKWIARLFGGTVAPPSERSRLRFRPGCEPLEARDVPASLYWLGTINTDAGTSGNWTEDPINLTPSLKTPHAGDDLFFDGALSGVDCTNLVPALNPTGGTDGDGGPGSGSADPALNSVHMFDGYGGTVTYGVTLWTHDLEMRSGTLNPFLGARPRRT